MEPVVSGQLRVEREGAHLALPDRHRMASDLGKHLDLIAELLDPGGSDEDGPKWRVTESGQLDVVFKAGELAAESVAAGRDVDQSEVIAIGDDHPGTGPEHRNAGGSEPPDRFRQPVLLHAHCDGGALAPGQYEAVELLEIRGGAHFDTQGTDRAEMPQVSGEASLKGEYADPERRAAGNRRPGATSPVRQALRLR